MEADWKKIRKEYLKGDTSYRKLAAKYGVSKTAIEHRAKAEQWQDGKRQIRAKTMTKTIDSMSDQEARIGTGLYDTALQLLTYFQDSMSAVAMDGAMAPDVLKEYGSALRQIQLVLDSKPSKLDIQEQEARIAKLRKEAQSDVEDDDTGVIMLPPVMEVDDA